MSKEFKAFEKIKEHHEIKGKDNNGNVSVVGYINEQELDIIEKALKDYEKRLALAKEYQDVSNVAKRLKALKIIKDKNVDSLYLRECCEYLREYNDACVSLSKPLTQEEYELLKEVLK